MAQSPVTLRALPGLPGRISFSPGNISKEVAGFTDAVLKERGQASLKPGFFESRSNAILARESEPEIRRLIDRHGPDLDTRLAERAIDRTQFRLEAKKTDRRAWFVSGGIFFGALLGFAAAGYGIGLAFTHFFSPAVAAGIQAGWNPVWYTVGGGIVGACTSLFNDKVTSPVRAWINRFGFKGAPVQANDIKNLTQELIFATQVENTADGRFNGGRFAATVFLTHAKPSFRQCGEELRRAAAAPNAEEKKTAIEIAAQHVGGFLVNSEMYWFNFDPHNVELFDEIRKNLQPNFARASADDIVAWRTAVIAHIAANRKQVESEGRPTLEAAIKDYYEPFLDRILGVAPRVDMKVDVQPASVAHAG